ncbi:MAG TPA: hypothetical protein VMR80_01465 [Candidatus Acidoferrum sp.]|nr:hypothetical protein [Candidatus Acidoferrum sp.]
MAAHGRILRAFLWAAAGAAIAQRLATRASFRRATFWKRSAI